MKYKIFGENTGLFVSELILGGAMFGTANGYGATKEEAFHMMQQFAEEGGNFIDTADAYQGGESEQIIGDFLSSRRDNFVLSSKFTRSTAAVPAVSMLGNNRKAMVQSVEHSLKRLKTDRIDIYIAHFDDEVTPAEELARGFEDLVTAGKIIYGGLSNYPAWKMAIAANKANSGQRSAIIALQTEYSLIQRAADTEIIPASRHFSLGVMAYSPLGGGLLTGKYKNNDEGRLTLMNNKAALQNAKNAEILDTVLNIAAETETSPGNVAVAWVISKGLFPVIGPRKIEHLTEYLSAVNLSLTTEQLQRLDEVSAISLNYPHDINVVQRSLMMDGRIKQ